MTMPEPDRARDVPPLGGELAPPADPGSQGGTAGHTDGHAGGIAGPSYPPAGNEPDAHR